MPHMRFSLNIYFFLKVPHQKLCTNYCSNKTLITIKTKKLTTEIILEIYLVFECIQRDGTAQASLTAGF